MKRGVPLIFCLLLVPSPSYAMPHISFDHLEYDFSVISQEEAAEHTFEFANTGGSELVIEKIVPS